MKVHIISALAIVLLSGISAAGPAQAQEPVIEGQWNITFIGNDGFYTGAIGEGVCFLNNGTWYSTTIPEWKGSWQKKGDRILWFGIYQPSTELAPFATIEFGQVVSRKLMTGDFVHYPADLEYAQDPPNAYTGNWAAARVKVNCN